MTGDDVRDTRDMDEADGLAPSVEYTPDTGSGKKPVPKSWTYDARTKDHPHTHLSDKTLRAWTAMGAPVWEQMPHESDREYGRFRMYCDMPPNERSRPATAAATGLSVAMVERLQLRYRWTVRAKAYDEERELGKKIAGVVDADMTRALVTAEGTEALPTFQERLSQRFRRHTEQQYLAGAMITQMFMDRVLLAKGLARNEKTGELENVEPQPLQIKDADWPKWGNLGNTLVSQALERMGASLGPELTVQAPAQEQEQAEGESEEQAQAQAQAPTVRAIAGPQSDRPDLSSLPTDKLRELLAQRKQA